MSEGDDDKLERLADRLRILRRRLTADEVDAHAREVDLYSYDDTLIVAADLLDLPVPPGAREEMGPDARTALEEALAAAGVDLLGG